MPGLERGFGVLHLLGEEGQLQVSIHTLEALHRVLEFPYLVLIGRVGVVLEHAEQALEIVLQLHRVFVRFLAEAANQLRLALVFQANELDWSVMDGAGEWEFHLLI